MLVGLNLFTSSLPALHYGTPFEALMLLETIDSNYLNMYHSVDYFDSKN